MVEADGTWKVVVPFLPPWAEWSRLAVCTSFHCWRGLQASFLEDEEQEEQTGT